MKESDWKIFKKIKEKAIERYCSNALQEFREVIEDEEEHPHNRYLLLYKLIRNRDKQIQLLFDGHSRSNAPLQLLAIRRENLVEEELLKKMSEDFLESTDPKNRVGKVTN